MLKSINLVILVAVLFLFSVVCEVEALAESIKSSLSFYT